VTALQHPASSTLKGLRRASVILVIVALAVCAVLGIVLLLAGAWGDTQGRVLVTAFVVALFATTALCHLAQVDRPLRAVGFAGIAASVLALVPALVLVWADWWTMGGDTAAWWWKSLAVLGILAGSLAQANLLLLLAGRRRSAVRIVLAITLVMIAVVAVMIWLPILSDGDIPGVDGEWYWRLFGVAAILDGLGTIVLPVLGLVLREAPAGFAVLALRVPESALPRLDALAAEDGSTRAQAAQALLLRGLEDR